VPSRVAAVGSTAKEHQVKVVVNLPGLSLHPGAGTHWWRSISFAEQVRAAQELDRLGYDYIMVPEHIVVHPSLVPRSGPFWVHSLSAAGFVLGATKTIKVACLVVVPYHRPIELAKALATLDHLSGGRLVVVALTGWSEWEFSTLGIPFASRGRMTDEYVDAMVELWTSESPAFDGEFVSFDEIVFEPKPFQEHLPVWMGGKTKRAIRRVAERGDGWLSYDTPRSEVPEMLSHLRSEQARLRRAGPIEISLPLYDGRRDPTSHTVVEPPKVILEPNAVLEQANEIARLGATVTDANVPLGTSVYQTDGADAPPPTRNLADYLERINWFAETVLPGIHDVNGVALPGPGT
jgi:probable F420-dependent oxidoreductase